MEHRLLAGLAFREDFKVPCKYLINIQDRFVTGKKPFFVAAGEVKRCSSVLSYSAHSRLSRRSLSVVTEQASELPVEGKTTMLHHNFYKSCD